MLSKQEPYIAHIGKFLVCDNMPNGFSVDSGRCSCDIVFFKVFFIREHCVALITVSPHSKLLVFLQTAYITPQNLIIGTHYMFRARCVNMGNLWHARAPLQPFQGMLHRLTTVTLQWFTYS